MPEGTDVIDCRGKLVAPGLIDMRAFVGEPGAGHRETLASASQAAAAGGVTTIICQPDTSPVIDDPAIVDFVLRRARDTAIVHVHPMAALTKGLEGEEMTEIGLLKAAGAVAFTDGDKSVTNAQVMRRALTYARDFDALIVHHTEDPDLIGDGVMNEGEFAARLGLLGIPKAAETIMLERDIRLVALTGRPLSRGVDHLRGIARGAAPRQGCRPQRHRLGLDQSPHAQRKRHRPLPHLPEDVAAAARRRRPQGAGRGGRRGLIDVVMSDHNPQDVETKRLPFAEAAPGAIGIETMLTAGLRLVHSGEIELIALLRAHVDAAGGTARPARRHAASGAPADVIVVDTDVPWVLDPRRTEIEMQEHAVRRSAHDRAASCAPSSPAAPSTNTYERPAHRCVASRVRLSARLDPVRADR